MKNFKRCLSMVLAIIVYSIAWGVNTESIYPYNDNGLWGLKINGEVCLLPGFDNLQKIENSNLFIYTDNGHKGIISPFGVIFPDEMADSIVSTNPRMVQYFRDSKKYVAFIDGYNGVIGNPLRVDGINYIGKKLFTYTVDGNVGARYYGDTSDIVVPGQYKELKGSWKFMDKGLGDEDFIAAIDKQGEIHLFDLRRNEDVSPFYPFSKLGGNAKKIAEGKKPLDDLWIKKYAYQIRDDISKESSKSYKKNGPKGVNTGWGMTQSITNTFSIDSIGENDIAEYISTNNYNGVVTTFGTITIPIKYNTLADLKKRNSANPYVLYLEIDEQMDRDEPKRYDTTWVLSSDERFEIFRQEFAEKTEYYAKYLALWEKLYGYIKEIGMDNDPIYEDVDNRIWSCRKLYNENSHELDRYNGVASVTNALNSLAGNLRNIASQMSSDNYNSYTNSEYDYGYSTSYSSSTYSGPKDYQSEYNRWAKRAEADYNSITRYSIKDKNGNKTSGSASKSSSPSTYVQQKKSYRTAQHEMARIAREASNAGVSIIKSEYETLPISY